jgi:hypothetical protein
MNAELLNTFLSEDGDAHSRQKLLDAIRKQRPPGAPMVREFTFNRFNVTLDFEGKQVSLQDDLTVGPQGEYKLSLDEFEKALQERK